MFQNCFLLCHLFCYVFLTLISIFFLVVKAHTIKILFIVLSVHVTATNYGTQYLTPDEKPFTFLCMLETVLGNDGHDEAAMIAPTIQNCWHQRAIMGAEKRKIPWGSQVCIRMEDLCHPRSQEAHQTSLGVDPKAR